MTFMFMRHDKVKCVYRKLNVADFQCKQNGKYTFTCT